MKTSVFESPGNIVIRDSEMPDINEEEVLVRLKGTGVCASNLPVWEGRDWFRYPIEPGAPGHEGYGIVERIGSSVRDVGPGDKVALISQHAYAEYDKAHLSEIARLPEEVGQLHFPGEPAACAVNIFRRSDLLRDQQVLIIGAGYLGCMLIQLAKNAGAIVTVVSRRETSLEYARIAGADHLIGFTDYYKALEQVKKQLPGGAPRIIEATGFRQSIDFATDAIAVRGRMIIAGYHQDGMRNVNMQVWNWKGIDIINAHERDPEIYVDGLKEAIRLTEMKILQPEKFITHYFCFENINEAFRLLKNRPESFMKAVITY
ncbi:MAG TPA: zinc-binding dehydrogenase [Bacteroidales bacterium]|nr:zinc-binding dehydrogenase [Bacteroidales bacterium]